MITEKIINKASSMTSEYDRISVSLFQEKFLMSYSEADKLMNILESKGIVGPANGAYPREVLKKNKYKQVKLNDFWSFVVLVVFAIGCGILLDIIIILLKK
jgi:hypothetical protein